MPSERVQRRIDELLDQADAAMAARDWSTVAESTRMVLSADAGDDHAGRRKVDRPNLIPSTASGAGQRTTKNSWNISGPTYVFGYEGPPLLSPPRVYLPYEQGAAHGRQERKNCWRLFGTERPPL